LISGLKGDKKLAEKTEKDVKEEEEKIVGITHHDKDMKKEVDEIKDFVSI